MKTHTIGTDTYAIFEHSSKGSLRMLHFIWGKKDFRLFLESKGSPAGGEAMEHKLAGKDGEFLMTRLQYLNNFEWYDFDGVTGHGLAHDEVRWKKNGARRHVDLPQHFYEVALELACREFDLRRKAPKALAG